MNDPDPQSWLQPKQPIWVHRNYQFIKAVIKELYKDIVVCHTENGQIIKTKKCDVFQRSSLQIQDSLTDLMSNVVINQPQILHHLMVRFGNKKIYTYVQSTLIAVNPYASIPELCTDKNKDYYIREIIEKNGDLKQFQPHIYSITAQMVKRLLNQNRDQAVIISGESGAGKTEANKQCLRFLARYFRKLNEFTSEQSNIQKTIMLSNPILQAFGNSKTIRNNNSSRFGKFLSIKIDKDTKIIRHAEIYNYLLEKSRIISRAKEEQNFHIFYQFLSKTDLEQKKRFFLIDKISKKPFQFQDFTYLKGTVDYIANPDVNFETIKKSLIILPDPYSYEYLCRILSAILHLGNLQITQNQNEDYCEIGPADNFKNICELLQVSEKQLKSSLTSYKIKAGGQQTIKQFGKRDIQQLIHSLSKTLYQKLFQWIINEINRATRLQSKNCNNLIALGFLDIYGFEVLKSNSLQQLFINYTNQRLHQIYLQKIFKIEKDHFIKQGLLDKFVNVNFEDNIKVIELLDYQKLSIFNLLDQQSAIASPDDSSLINKFRFNYKNHQKFPKANLNMVSTQFMIRHTPQDIQYNVMGFKQKNKDLLRDQIKNVMKMSNLPVLSNMVIERPAENDGLLDPKAHRIRKFLSPKFRKQMNELVNGILDTSELHFIRCIKSNGNKKPMGIDQEIMYSQIKYLGILDTIKIKKMGYSVKLKYSQIDEKYKWLVRKNILKAASHEQTKKMITSFLPRFGEEDIIYGNSRVFFKHYAYTILSKQYQKLLDLLNYRAHQVTSFFVKITYEKKKAVKNYYKMTIINYFKSFVCEKKYKKILSGIRKVQKSIRQLLIYRGLSKKQDNIMLLQSYIKRNIESKNKIRKLNLIYKVVYKFKSLLFRKKAKSTLVSKYIIERVIFQKCWKQIQKVHINIIQKYIQSLKTKIKAKDKIKTAMINQRNVIQSKCLEQIELYLHGFAKQRTLSKSNIKVKKIQASIRAYIAATKYNRLRRQIILIQKAIRQYIFMKKGVKQIFQQTYSEYWQNLKLENKKIENKLYDNQQSKATNINSQLKKFLSKFKQRISLLYFIIDFESFIELQIVYPNQSWVQNYLDVFQQGLTKNDPIQYVSVGESFTVVSNTSKMYTWGIHSNSKSGHQDLICQIKTKMPIKQFHINKNKLNFQYDQEQTKDEQKKRKFYQTIAKKYFVENGKLYENVFNSFTAISGIPTPERVAQISCGRGHTILRTSSKKVYTFGNGHQGQLGHGSFTSEQNPRAVRFFQKMQIHPIQVVASWTSSIVVMSNHKMYWFGKNSTLSQVSIPLLFELKEKSELLNNNDFCVARALASWSRTMSVIGVTIICYNGKLGNNRALRNKITDILVAKWQQAGIYNINPPISSISDHLQQCHVKLKPKKVNIHPESKEALKQIESKIKFNTGNSSFEMKGNGGSNFSFANTQRNQFFK